jgi:hypothetical protein
MHNAQTLSSVCSIEGDDGRRWRAAAGMRRTPLSVSRLGGRVALGFVAFTTAGLLSYAAQAATLPRVSILATDPDASVIGPNRGQFLFTRTAGTDESGNALPLDPLTVSYTIGGTAINGTDYAQISATLTFAQDAATATLVITPLGYNPPSGERTVDLTLTTDETSYTVDPTQSGAAVTIQEAQPPPPCTQECDPSQDPSCCKNQLLIDAYDTACQTACNVAVNTVQLLGQACYDACNDLDAAYTTICGWSSKAACELASGACDATYDACVATGAGTGCNTAYTSCVAGCWKTYWRLISDRDARRSCIGSCGTSRTVCINSKCGNLGNSCLSCSGNNDCESAIANYCGACESGALGNCENNCDKFAPPCILKKEAGEACTGLGPLSDCDTNLSCRIDPTGFQNLGVDEIVKRLLPLPDLDSMINDMKAAATDPQTYLDVTCAPGNTDCVCQQPVLQLSADSPTALALACAALYQPYRHLEAWVANQDVQFLGGLRDSIVSKLQAAGAPQALIDAAEDRFKDVAFTYGAGAGVDAVAGLNSEIGTLYDGQCYGCYLSWCAHGTAAAGVDLGATKGVADVTGSNDAENGIENYEGWAAGASVSAGFDIGVDADVEAGLEFEVPQQVEDFLPPLPSLGSVTPKDLFSEQGVKDAVNKWKNDYVDAVKGQINSAVTDPSEYAKELIDGLLESAIPGGGEIGWAVGGGIGPPVNAEASLCATWVVKSLCLSLDTSNNNECLSTTPIVSTNDLPTPVTYPPVALCKPTVTIAAAAPPTCDASASIDGGSYAPDGGQLTLTQNPPGPYPIGTTVVTLTATEGQLSSTCQGSVNVVDLTPPDLTCPSDVTQECTGNEHAIVSTGSATATDCSHVMINNPPPASYPVGTTEVDFSATDTYDNKDSCSIEVAVQDTKAPTITAPGGIRAECTSPAGTPVVLGTPTAGDVCDPSPSVTNNALALYPLGSTTVTWTAKDRSGNQSSATQTVTVQDTTSPSVQASLQHTLLWPPEHGFVNVGLGASVADVCDPDPTIRVTVFSNEGDATATGDGTFSPDAVDIGLNTLKLRGERKGNASGRVYVVAVTATDASGNTGVDCATAVVPHDSSKASIASVNTQAAAAKALCISQLGDLSAAQGYFVVGDAP